MHFFGRGRSGSKRSREQALSNPIRRRIVELFTTDEARSLTAKALAESTSNRFATVSVGQVGYHLACLRDAELIPGDRPEAGSAR